MLPQNCTPQQLSCATTAVTRCVQLRLSVIAQQGNAGGQALTAGCAPMQGTAGSAPEPSAVAAALQGHQLFVYLGHGGGEQYIGAPYCQSGAPLPVGRQAAMCAPTHFGTVRRSGTRTMEVPRHCVQTCVLSMACCCGHSDAGTAAAGPPW